MADLLLIESPVHRPNEEKVDIPPLGLAYMAAVARVAGFSVEILDLNVEEPKKMEGSLSRAGLVAVSSYTHNYDKALGILHQAKAKGRDVVLGGPHGTPLYREALQDGFDYVIRGEGEYPMLHLLEGDKRGRGIAYLEDGEVRSNYVDRVKDLDTLPFPARDMLNLERYSFPGALSTTRGCASMCLFCSSRSQSGILRARSVRGLEKEVGELMDLKVESLFVMDPNFAFDKRRVIDFTAMIRRKQLPWFSELRLDHVDLDIIKAMADSGCRVVRFGVESGSQHIIENLRKGIDLGRLKKVIASFVSVGVVPVCGFMIGLPGERAEDFQATLDLARWIKRQGGEATFSILTPYPGTYLYKNAEKLGIEIKTKDWRRYNHLEPVIETDQFSSEDLVKMLEHALAEVGQSLDARRSFRSICREALEKS